MNLETIKFILIYISCIQQKTKFEHTICKSDTISRRLPFIVIFANTEYQLYAKGPDADEISSSDLKTVEVK